jgi:hypothetical protein
MSNLGSPKTSKEHARISGNVVITTIDMSGTVLNANVSGQILYVATSGNTLQVDGSFSISGSAVFAYISGGTITASTDISGQVVRVGETFITQRNLGSSQSVIVSTSYTSQTPTTVDVVNLNLAASPASVSGGLFEVDVLTSSASFPFVRNALYYKTCDYPTAKSICYYPDAPLVVASGDIISVKYTNNTIEFAEARIEMILTYKV